MQKLFIRVTDRRDLLIMNKKHGVYLVQVHCRISFIPEMQVDFGREGEIYGRNFFNFREI